MIIEQAVTNHVVGMGLLTQIGEPARALLNIETTDVVADAAASKARTSRLAKRPVAFLMPAQAPLLATPK